MRMKLFRIQADQTLPWTRATGKNTGQLHFTILL